MEQLSMNQTKNNVVRTHRVGSITAGCSLIVWGIMFILYEVGLLFNLEMVLKLWPLILIGLGVEVLLNNTNKKTIIYDKGAIFIMIIMAGFAMMMACADMCIKYVGL